MVIACLLSSYYNCDLTAIRLRFDYDDNYQNYDSTAIRLVRESGHHDSMLMKVRIYRAYQTIFYVKSG